MDTTRRPSGSDRQDGRKSPVLIIAPNRILILCGNRSFTAPKGADTLPAIATVISRSQSRTFTQANMQPMRNSSAAMQVYGVPYSEHSSFRELTMFCTALRIEKVIPTVNVGSAKSRERMKAWCERWAVERKKNGVYELPADGSW